MIHAEVIHMQQRRRHGQKHREKIKRYGGEDKTVPADISEAVDHLRNGTAASVAFGTWNLADQAHAKERDAEQCRARPVSGSGSNGIDISADRGADDHTRLPRDTADRDGLWQGFAWDQIGGERRKSRTAERPCDTQKGGDAENQRQAYPILISRERERSRT